MSEEERRVAFHHKRLGQRAAIVAAGPIANFVYAIIALAFLYVAFGQQVTPAQIGSVVEGSAAEAAGLQAGDRIIAIDGRSIERFEEVQLSVQSSTGDPMQIDVLRDGKPLSLTVTPEMTTVTTRFGDERKVARLGITASGTELVHLDPASAIGQAFRETVMIVDLTLSAFGEMLVGARDSSDLAGVIGIAQMSGGGRAGQPADHAMVHRHAVDQSWPGESVPHSNTRRRPPAVLWFRGRSGAPIEREGPRIWFPYRPCFGIDFHARRDMERFGPPPGSRFYFKSVLIARDVAKKDP